MALLRLSTVNKALPGDLELVKGEGYFYFAGTGMESVKTASVYVPRLNDLSLDRWIAEATDLMAEYEAIKAGRA